MNGCGGLARSGAQYVVFGNEGLLMTSPDGLSWTPAVSGSTNALIAVGWSSELTLFVVVGAAGTILTRL